MSIIPENKYPNNITPANAEYPQGKARNVVTPGDGTGTPLDESWLNDLWGWQQAILKEAGIVPSGEPDTAEHSQYLQALKKLATKTVDGYEELRLVDPSKDDYINVRGRNEPGDAAGGVFKWSAGSSKPDPLEGIYVTSEGGQWERVVDGWVRPQWWGATGDGDNDDTPAIHAARATGRGVYFPKPSNFYRITDEIGPKFEGQILYSESRKPGTFRNLDTPAPFALFGDPDDETSPAPRSQMINMYFRGNSQSTGGIILPSSRNKGNANWSDFPKDCAVIFCGADDVGAGWSLECYTWCNTVSGFSSYGGSKRGAIFADSANQNTISGMYITGCEEESFRIGGDGTGRSNRGNIVNGIVVQQSGGVDGCMVLGDCDNTVINGVYSEYNNRKNADLIINIQDTARGTTINGVNHLAGGSGVIDNKGKGTVVNNVTSSSVSGVMVRNSGDGEMVCIGVTPLDGASGIPFADNSANKSGLYIDPLGFNKLTINSFAPEIILNDKSENSEKVRIKYDGDLLNVACDSQGDGGYSQNMLYFNRSVPEMVVNGILRPQEDNTHYLGTNARRWAVIYSATGAINTSDERLKTEFKSPDDRERKAAQRIKREAFGKYQFTDGSRTHYGVGAQTVARILTEEGLNPEDYAFYCYDEWPERPAIVSDDGSILDPHTPAGNRYGIRYDELYAFILCAL